jgi:hypothetical protein
MRHRAATICVFASLALAVAGCGSQAASRPPHTTGTTSTTGATSTTGTTSTTSTTQAPATAPSSTTANPSDMTTVSVTGSGGTAETITIDEGGTTTHHDHVPLPYTLMLPGTPEVTVKAQTTDQSPDATISCRVDSPGGSSSSATSSGPGATVTCG